MAPVGIHYFPILVSLFFFLDVGASSSYIISCGEGS